MGFLTMIGAVSAEEHAKVSKDRDSIQGDLLKEAAAHEATKRSLKGADAENQRLARGWDKCGDDLKTAQRQLDKTKAELAEAQAAYDNERSDLKNATQTIKGLRAQLEAAQQLIEQHKTDAAELATFRAARDRDNELRRQRRAKVKPAETAKTVVKAKPAKKAVRK